MWNAYTEPKKLEDLLEYDQVRAPRYAYARANRTLPREPYQEPLVPLLYAGEPDDFASELETDASMPNMVSETSEGEEQSDGADPLVDFVICATSRHGFRNIARTKRPASANQCFAVSYGIK